MLAQKIGRNIIPVVEKHTELGLILEVSQRIGVRPQIGMRVKLASRARPLAVVGRLPSKFGLTVTEIMRGLEELKSHGMADCLKLLHFHLGSQITNIRIVKGALNEAVASTPSWPSSAPACSIDVGGGLGVDYDGSQTNFESSMNYTLQDTPTTSSTTSSRCATKPACPTRPSSRERPRRRGLSQRARVQRARRVGVPRREGADHRQPGVGTALLDLVETYNNVTARNALEAFHDAQQALDMTLSLFSAGYPPLEQRNMAENLFWAIATKLQRIAATMSEVPEDLQNLDEQLSDTYFCNFSLFQSIPDSWAIAALPGDADPPAQRKPTATPSSATSPAIRMASWIGSWTGAT
jgi:arginine decarboxylase